MLRRLGSTLLGLLLLAGAARAEDAADPASDEAYKTAISRALQEFQLGHWNEARVYFGQAHALRASARTLRGIALSLYESRSYVEALPFMERALAEPVLPLTAAMRREVENLRDQARLFVSRLYVTSEPVDAEVKVDQRAAAREGDGAILLDPGDHELVLSAAGYEPESRTLRARSGEALRAHYKLKSLQPEPRVSVSVAPETVQPMAARPARTASTRSSTLPWIVIGTSAALLAAGGVMLGLAAADKAAVEHPDSTHWSDVSSAYERGSTLFPLGYVLAGVGLAGLATGIVLKLWPAERAAQDAAAKLELTPGRVTFRLSL